MQPDDVRDVMFDDFNSPLFYFINQNQNGKRIVRLVQENCSRRRKECITTNK